MQIYTDGLTDSEDESAGIFETPIDIWYGKMDVGNQAIIGYVQVRLQSDIVVDTMEVEISSYFNLGVSLKSNMTANRDWLERYFREPIAFQDFLVHLSVAPLIAALPAAGVHYYQSGHLARGGVELQSAPFQCERSVHRM